MFRQFGFQCVHVVNRTRCYKWQIKTFQKRARVCTFLIANAFFLQTFLKDGSFCNNFLIYRYIGKPQPPELAAPHWWGYTFPFSTKRGLGFSYPAASHLSAVFRISPVLELLATAKL